ncbi:hypothetical protein [Caballeronia sp.]|uniref:hypothetical protein n=1 Tax=Caballeronia sp. TaxID=1931223 RepID=UPI003C64CF63
MSSWMIFCSIWALFALCVVLFIRGAHPHVKRPEADTREEGQDSKTGGLKVAPVRHENGNG